MSKILFIDVWERGYRNFTRLNREFEDNGFSTLLVHISSFSQNDYVEQEFIDGLLIRDISYYKTIFIKKVIEIEKPDIILILNLSFIFDRVIVNICKSKNIKIVYLAHGKLINPSEANKAQTNLNRKIWKSTNRIFRKKNFLVWLNYILSLESFKRIYLPFKIIISAIIKPSQYLTFGSYCKELDADLILLYTSQDKQLMTEKFNFPENKISVVGNPEITTFYNSELDSKSDFLKKINLNSNIEYALYLDDGLVSGGEWSAKEWYLHLKQLSEAIMPLKLIIKLHPRENLEEHLKMFNEIGVFALTDANFKNLIFHSKYVISHYSSTILYALIFNKRVFVPRWGKSKEFHRNYPDDIVNYCYSIESFKAKIDSNLDIDLIKNKKYLLSNGVNIDENSIQLIVSEISNLAK